VPLVCLQGTSFGTLVAKAIYRPSTPVDWRWWCRAKIKGIHAVRVCFGDCITHVAAILATTSVGSYSHQFCLDSPFHSLLKPSLSLSPLSASATPSLSVQAENPPFQQIIPTLIDLWYLLDCLHWSVDWTELSVLIGSFLVRFLFKFSVWFRTAGVLKYTESYRVVVVSY